ncbi:hypothetical protein V8D89_013362 [Ganoderma adspersum]
MMDNEWFRFSETGAALLVDFVFKHARRHGNCASATCPFRAFPSESCAAGGGAEGRRILDMVRVVAVEDDLFRFETRVALSVRFARSSTQGTVTAPTLCARAGEFPSCPAGRWAGARLGRYTQGTPDQAVKWELVVDSSSA